VCVNQQLTDAAMAFTKCVDSVRCGNDEEATLLQPYHISLALHACSSGAAKKCIQELQSHCQEFSPSDKLRTALTAALIVLFLDDSVRHTKRALPKVRAEVAWWMDLLSRLPTNTHAISKLVEADVGADVRSVQQVNFLSRLLLLLLLAVGLLFSLAVRWFADANGIRLVSSGFGDQPCLRTQRNPQVRPRRELTRPASGESYCPARYQTWRGDFRVVRAACHVDAGCAETGDPAGAVLLHLPLRRVCACPKRGFTTSSSRRRRC
jgi:hypothetical protein